jgi:uncharacterized protein
MGVLRWFVVAGIGAFTGLLGGLFGKGGSAIATPLLHLAGVPSLAAIASPLPATIPSTLIAAWAYHRVGAIDRQVLRTTLTAGVPATIAGAIATRWIGGAPLIVVTELVVAALGAKILVSHRRESETPITTFVPSEEVVVGRGGRAATTVAPTEEVVVGRERRAAVRVEPGASAAREPVGPFMGAANRRTVVAIAMAVGLAAGLLGNSGGFLLAPLFITILHLPVKRALGTSLAAAAGLAVPGTIVHAALGHIDWTVVFAFGAASVPLSAVGARCALRTAPGRLELAYGAALVLLGVGLLVVP